MHAGEVVAGRFEILQRTAEGGTSVVYRARDVHTEQLVAIKSLSDESLINQTRFGREAELLATLNHPRIVRYIAHGISSRGDYYLVEEWIEGETFADYWTTIGLSAQQSVSFVRSVAEALSHAHALGIVHRDLKPSNLILERGDLERVKVVDFGIARYIDDPAHLTRTGVMVGTPRYMSPEQAHGRRTIDARTDVFALGCLLYSCLTGHHAFPGYNVLAIRAKVLKCTPEPVDKHCPEAPVELTRLVDETLSKNPDRRPLDGAALAQWLASIPRIPEDKVRRLGGQEPETATIAPKKEESFKCVVMAACMRPAAQMDAASELSPQAIYDGLEAIEGETYVFPDGNIVFLCPDRSPQVTQVRSGLQVGFTLLDFFDDAIVILSSSVDANWQSTLDHGARTLHNLYMNAIFADYIDFAPKGRCLAIDAAMEEFVPEEYTVLRDARGGSWVHQ